MLLLYPAYFKHPSLICSPVVQPGVDPGRGLYIQMGFDPVTHYEHIPLQSHNLSPLWVPGECRPQMGNYIICVHVLQRFYS